MTGNYYLEGTSLFFEVPAELDHCLAEQVRRELEFLMGTYQVREIVLDFRYTDFMDSSGIGLIMGRYQTMKYCGGSVRAVHLNKRIRRIFMMSGLHKIISMEEGDGKGNDCERK